MYEHFFQCPYCWEQISMLLDPSNSGHSYVEDCEVCCNPIELTPIFMNGDLAAIEIGEIGQ